MRKGLGRAMGIAVSLVLAAVLAGYGVVFSPYTELPCPSGLLWYSGLVTNTTGAGVGGVIVDLYTRPSYPADVGRVVTDASGHWSIILNGCPHAARFYWASDADGPLLNATAGGYVPLASQTLVAVSQQPLNLTWVREYPDDGNVSISFALDGSLLAEAEANITGHPATGFLARTSSGVPGSSAVLGGSFTTGGGSPYAVDWAAGTAYRVVGTNGSAVTYLALWPGSHFRVVQTTEFMNMQGAIQTDERNSIYPFVTVAPLGVDTYRRQYTWAPGNATGNLTLLGATIPLRFNLSQPFVQTIIVALRNTTPYNECFVRFANVMEHHWWYYGNGTCPPS